MFLIRFIVPLLLLLLLQLQLQLQLVLRLDFFLLLFSDQLYLGWWHPSGFHLFVKGNAQIWGPRPARNNANIVGTCNHMQSWWMQDMHDLASRWRKMDRSETKKSLNKQSFCCCGEVMTFYWHFQIWLTGKTLRWAEASNLRQRGAPVSAADFQCHGDFPWGFPNGFHRVMGVPQ